LQAVATLYDPWAEGRVDDARRAVARGQALFNSRAFGPRRETCGSCHNTPNVGTDSRGIFFDLGLSDEAHRTPDLPLYVLQCVAGPRIGEIFRTTDPGRALVTGRCADIGRFKAPGLRGLAARPPYFHNGAAATLGDVLDFYDALFAIGLGPQDKADLIAFLRAL
jgi:cytochrome c peroxidase